MSKSLCSLIYLSILVFVSTGVSANEGVTYIPAPGLRFCPRINNLGEVVWGQGTDSGYMNAPWSIHSNRRGVIGNGTAAGGLTSPITSSVLRDVSHPDINDLGEVVAYHHWAADGSFSMIWSSDRGILISGDRTSTPSGWPVINNPGEVAWAGSGAGTRIHSSTRGAIAFNLWSDLSNPSINNQGLVVWQQSPNSVTSAIWTEGHVRLSDESVYAEDPEINDLGEVVWTQRASSSDPFQIWSSLRGQLSFTVYDNLNPAMNDLGEVVWSSWDGTDWEIFSSVRGQITDNVINDFAPDINNRGQIVWAAGTDQIAIIPEPATACLLALGGMVATRRLRRR